MEIHAVLVGLVLAFSISKGNAVCAPVTDKSVSKSEGDLISLHCSVTNQNTDTVKWLHPNGDAITSNCTSSNARFSVDCQPPKYLLVFNATWADRGQFWCMCQDTGYKLPVKVTVKVPPKTLTASCIVKDTKGVCNLTSRKGSDILQFSATAGCAYPTPTLTWSDDMGETITTSDLKSVAKNTNCVGAQADQRSSSETFEVSWAELEKPSQVHVAAANEAGGKSLNLLIHKAPETEDSTGVIIGSIIGVILLLILIGLIIFLVIRSRKEKKKRLAYV